MTKLKKIGVLSFAKFQAIFMAILGLIMGIFTAVVGVIYGGILSSFQEGITSVEEAELVTNTLSPGLLYGLGFFAIIVFPILYAILGFIAGVVIAWIYNLIAKWTGGIEVELSE